MTVILVKLDTHFSNIKNPPLGLMYIANSLEKEGHEVKLLHSPNYYHLKEDIPKFVEAIKKEKPLFVGLSVMTGMQTRYSGELCERIKNECGDIPIVWGGPHASSIPEQCLEEDYIDFVVVGDGEDTSVELARELTKKRRDFSKITGLAYKDHGELKMNPRRQYERNLDKYAIAWHLIDVEKYLFKGGKCERAIVYTMSRGCPYRCAFCYNQTLGNTVYRSHSFEHVMKDLNELKEKYKIDGVYFFDDNLFVNQKMALEIINEMGLYWFGEIRINQVTEDFAKKVHENGKCLLLGIGAESGNDRVLEMIKKDITTDMVREKTKILVKYRIPLDYYFIIGFPGETEDEVVDTLKFIQELEKLYSNSKIFNAKLGIYNPYPGTPLYLEALKRGFKQPKDTKSWEVMDRYDIKFSFPWMDKLKLKAMFLYYRYWKFSKFHSTYMRPDLHLFKKIYEKRLENKNFELSYDVLLYSRIEEFLRKLYYRKYK